MPAFARDTRNLCDPSRDRNEGVDQVVLKNGMEKEEEKLGENKRDDWIRLEEKWIESTYWMIYNDS